MDGFLMYWNVKNVELLYIKFVDFLNLENLNVNILCPKIKIPNSIINGGSVVLIPARIVLFAIQFVLGWKRICVFGVEELNMDFVIRNRINVILER